MVAQGEFCVLKDGVAHCYIGRETQPAMSQALQTMYEAGMPFLRSSVVACSGCLLEYCTALIKNMASSSREQFFIQIAITTNGV